MDRRSIHWVDRIADRIQEFLDRRGKSEFVFNGGLSVSGVQHIGRLRGEILIPEAIRRVLEERGYKIKQLLTLYTQDPWKGKQAQRAQFKDSEEAKKYTGWPLIRVPDPMGCHENWVEHYWQDFGPYLEEFTDGRIEIVTTTELYKTHFKKFILKKVLPNKEKIREIINKYRGRKPYPENWIPIEPICENCGRIDKTEALEVLENGRVRYKCHNCGHVGEADISNAKINWRIEWAGVWYILGVDFEPYGKDHATPGGSRDSCVDLAVNALGFEPPEGEWYEWVSIRIGGRSADMTSSGFIGVTPREWLEIAHPHILRFLYFSTHPHRKVVVDLQQIPQYYEMYYKAERIYFNAETTGDEEQDLLLKRTYELSQPRKPPAMLPAQVPYTHAAILAQLVGPDNVEEALNRLRKTGHLKVEDEYSISWVTDLLRKSYNWIMKYAPDRIKVSILREELVEVESFKHKIKLCELGRKLENVREWNEEIIKETMIAVTGDLSAKERREFYREFYLLFTGEPQGPRAAPLLALLERKFVVNRLKLLC